MSSLISKAKHHCIYLLEHSRCAEMPYHNLQHTCDVYRNVQLIGGFEDLDEPSFEILKLAALFHDTGLSEAYHGHEEVSAKNAQRFLESIDYPKAKLEQVIACIQATRLPQQPKSVLEKVICDADLFHLSNDDFLEKNKLLRQEWEQYLNKVYTESEWHELNTSFLENHQYHTVFGSTVLKFGKLKNNVLMISIKNQLDSI